MKHEPWRPYEVVCNEVYYCYELQVDVAERLDNIIFSIIREVNHGE